MRKLAVFLCLGLGFLISCPTYFGLGAFAIYVIVTMFIDRGVMAGIISIPIAGIIWAITYFAISFLILTPLTLLTGKLAIDIEEKEQLPTARGDVAVKSTTYVKQDRLLLPASDIALRFWATLWRVLFTFLTIVLAPIWYPLHRFDLWLRKRKEMDGKKS